MWPFNTIVVYKKAQGQNPKHYCFLVSLIFKFQDVSATSVPLMSEPATPKEKTGIQEFLLVFIFPIKVPPQEKTAKSAGAHAMKYSPVTSEALLLLLCPPAVAHFN